jgi:fatty-acyl-CoA synthase
MTLSISHATGPTKPPIADVTIGELLRGAASKEPARPAIIEGIADATARRQWTYSELLMEAEHCAYALAARFSKGERVACWAHNIPEWVILEYGCALAGLVLVTVNPAYRPDELKYVLTQSRAAGLFVVPEFRGSAMLNVAKDVQSTCPALREIISFDDWLNFLASGESERHELPLTEPEDPMMIQYTSGTTGFPKGAYLHHRGLHNNAAHFLDRMGIVDGAVYIQTMPLFHTSGSAMGVLGCASHNNTMVLVDAFEPGLVLELFETYKAEGMLGVPTMLIAMIEHPRFKNANLSNIKGICSGGSLVPEQLVRKLEAEIGAPFTIVYGQTECSPVATMTQASDSIDDKSSTIGPLMPHVEARIVDPATHETLPIGSIGEFVTRGYHVMHEYFDMPEQTAETLDSDGWLHTGDLAAMDARGYCTIEGRLKDMIIRGGENIYPKELEELLFAHASVGEVAVVGLPNDRWGETVAAFVRATPGHEIDKGELFAYLRLHLAPHKTPKQWFQVHEFPLTGSGKIQKFKLREQWLNGKWKEL